MTRKQSGRRPSPKRLLGPDGRVTVRGKAGNGEGSVFWEAARQRWCAKRSTTTVDGGSKVVRAYGPTRDAATSRLVEKLSDERRPGATFDRRTVTVAEYARWWLDEVKVAQVE